MTQSTPRIKLFEFIKVFPERHPTIGALFILYLPIVVFIGPMLISDGYLFKGDVSFNFAPFTMAGMEQWKNGNIPFWSHLVQCGFSLLGDGMGALLYPPLILVYFLFPSTIAYNADIAIHIFIAAFVMYIYCRSLAIKHTGSILASWLWIFAGPVMGYLGSPALHCITWMPLSLFLIDRLFIPKKFFSTIVFLSVIYGLGWLGGLPQFPVYNSLMSLFYFLFRLSQKWKIDIRTNLTIAAGWITAVLLGIGIGMLQLLPTLENGAYSIRAGGVDYAFATYGSLFPAGIAGFIFPAWSRLAGYWLAGPNLFFGYPVIGLALLTLHRKPVNRDVYFFWALLCLGCLLSFGKFNPLYKLIYHIPGLHFLRVPSRLLIFSQFSICIIGAIGFDSICRCMTDHEQRIKVTGLFKKTGVSLALALSLMVIGNVLLNVARKPLFEYARHYVNRSIRNNNYSLQDADYYYQRITTMFNDIYVAINPVQPAVLIPFFATIGSLFVLVVWIKKGKRDKLHYWFLFFCLINLFIFVPKPADALQVKRSPPSPLTEYLKQQKKLFRIYNINYRENVAPNSWSEEKLDPSFNMFHHIDNVGVYSSLGVKRYYELMGRLGAANCAFGIQPVTDSIVEKYKHLLDFMNVKFFTSDRVLKLPELEKTPITGPPFLYENKSVFPRAFLVPHAEVIPDSEMLLKKLYSDDFEPGKVVYLEAPPEKRPDSVENFMQVHSVPTIASYGNDRVVIDAEGPGWCVLTDLYYPGWNATVNGVAEKIYRANYVFRAIPLDAGRNRIIFKYTSSPFKRGCIIGIFSLIVMVILFLRQLTMNRTPPANNDRSPN